MNICGHKDKIIINKKTYIDLSYNSGVLFFGHSSRIIKKIFRDFEKKNISLFKKDSSRLVMMLQKLYPNYKKFIVGTTGSEAITKSLRICRGLTGKSKIANVSGSWHGSVDETLYMCDKNLSAK